MLLRKFLTNKKVRGGSMSIEELMTCFCKTRELQSIYSKCLENSNLTELEKELFQDLIQCAVASSNKIKNVCERLESNN
jgi:hypothetical protein